MYVASQQFVRYVTPVRRSVQYRNVCRRIAEWRSVRGALRVSCLLCGTSKPSTEESDGEFRARYDIKRFARFDRR